MKIPFAFAAAAMVASALSAPAAAGPGLPGHAHVIVAPGAVALTPMFHKRPDWAYRIDRSVLHPIPKPFPWPGPNPCLSCPPMEFDERVTTPREILR